MKSRRFAQERSGDQEQSWQWKLCLAPQQLHQERFLFSGEVTGEKLCFHTAASIAPLAAQGSGFQEGENHWKIVGFFAWK